MTTIAVNRDAIACDMQMTYREHTKLKIPTKILHITGDVCKDMFGIKEAYIGFSGNADQWGEVVSWFCLPENKPPKCKGIEFLMLGSNKKIYHATNLNNWMMLPDKYFAIGSGMQFAIASMAAGKTPLEAVKIASKHDPGTGMGFKSYSFD